MKNDIRIEEAVKEAFAGHDSVPFRNTHICIKCGAYTTAMREFPSCPPFVPNRTHPGTGDKMEQIKWRDRYWLGETDWTELEDLRESLGYQRRPDGDPR